MHIVILQYVPLLPCLAYNSIQKWGVGFFLRVGPFSGNWYNQQTRKGFFLDVEFGLLCAKLSLELMVPNKQRYLLHVQCSAGMGLSQAHPNSNAFFATLGARSCHLLLHLASSSPECIYMCS